MSLRPWLPEYFSVSEKKPSLKFKYKFISEEPMAYKILKTELFDRKFAKLSPDVQKAIEKIRDKLKENPFEGKPLHSDFFREKKYKKYRIYYLIYKECLILYLITISEKKDQQTAINTVMKFLEIYRQEVEEWVKQNKSNPTA